MNSDDVTYLLREINTMRLQIADIENKVKSNLNFQELKKLQERLKNVYELTTGEDKSFHTQFGDFVKLSLAPDGDIRVRFTKGKP